MPVAAAGRVEDCPAAAAHGKKPELGCAGIRRSEYVKS